MPKTAALIINTGSRRGAALFDETKSLIEAKGIMLDAHAVDDPQNLDKVTLAALDKKPDLLIVGGGDGTQASLAGHLIGRDTVLGVLPLGTANSFARALELPLELPEAVDVIAEGNAIPVDLGMVGDHYFVGTAAIGMSPLIAETVPDGLKRVLGRAGYLIWAAWKFLRFHPFTLILGEGDDAKRLRVVEVRIANGGYLGGTEVVDDAEVDNGRIIISAVKGHVKRRLLANWLATVLRHEARKDDVEDFYFREVKLSTEPPLPVSVDGEIRGRTPKVIKVIPKAIRVMVAR